MPPRDAWWKELVRPYYLKWFYFRVRPEACPEAWRQCWRYPSAPLAEARVVLGDAPAAGVRDFFFLPMNDWHVRFQRGQHLARALARLGARVFYLNPHLGREYPRPAAGCAPHLARLEPGIFELHVPLPREPVFHHRRLRRSEEAAIVEALRQVARECGVVEPAVLLSFPLWNGVARELGAPVLYDCHDLLGGFGRIAPEIVDAEDEAFEQAAAVLFTAEGLRAEALRRRPGIAAKSHLAPNGVDAGHFRPARRPRGGAAAPVAGYVGALDTWFDAEAVRCAAERHPGFRFRLFGRVEDRRLLALGALPNVELCGEVPYHELPARMAEFDAALIPFLRTPLTLATNPIKLYEYFSCGLPVVSTRLPEVERYADLVYLADSAAEFAAAVGRAGAERSGELTGRRIAVAERESWGARARQILGILQ